MEYKNTILTTSGVVTALNKVKIVCVVFENIMGDVYPIFQWDGVWHIWNCDKDEMVISS